MLIKPFRLSKPKLGLSRATLVCSMVTGGFLAAMQSSYLQAAEWSEEDIKSIYIYSAKNPEHAFQSEISQVTITRAMIAESGAQDIEQLLKAYRGIDITRTGGQGSQSSIFVRGSNANHTKILINGIAVNTASSDTGNLNQISLNRIEKIEIIRGARAHLYGANTIGGVINIITTPAPQKNHTTVGVGVGNQERYQAQLAHQQHHKGQDFSASFSGSHLGGQNATQQDIALANEDRDGIDQTQAELHWFNDVTLNDSRLKTGVSIVHQQGQSEFDDMNTFLSSGSEGTTDFRQDIVSGFSQISYQKNFSTKLSTSFFESEDEYTSSSYALADTSERSRYQTKRANLSVENAWNAHLNHRFFLGVEAEKENMDLSASYATLSQDERNNVGLYILGDEKFSLTEKDSGTFLEWSIRTDDNDSFERTNTTNIGLGRQITPQYFTQLHYSTAFRAPNFNELYVEGAYSKANPLLRPEKSELIEWKHLWQIETHTIEMSLFKSNVQDLILSNFKDGFFVAENIGIAQIQGTELYWQFPIMSWQNSLSMTWLKPEDKATGLILPKRAQRLLKWSTYYRYGKQGFGYNFTAESERFNSLANTSTSAGFGLVALNYRYHFNKDTQVNLDIENAFDRQYETVPGYFEQRRAFVLSWTQAL